MICSVTGPAQRQEFDRRIAGRPYFEATMGTHCALFGAHPASGWQFCLLPGTAALALRGGTATVCGVLPEGETGDDAREELAGFLRFLGVDRLVAAPAPPARLARGGTAAAVGTSPGPRAAAAARPAAGTAAGGTAAHAAGEPPGIPRKPGRTGGLLLPACTALAHGFGVCRTLWAGERPVCTVGCYEQSGGEAYLSAGVTAPDWRGRGLASWLIVGLADDLAAARTVRFACAPALGPFYDRLGFAEAGALLQFTRK